MSDAAITSSDGILEPAKIDETTSMDLRILATGVDLKGAPSGTSQCDNCAFYLEPTADISYCWHPALRILVGATWWCDRWEVPPDGV